ncbi:ATP-binding protein [Streptomyces collinus]|uniref:ATP-binding protein n=1 Tax=Streptomyces collinus TaxID=42684 RepID=UPI003684FB7B
MAPTTPTTCLRPSRRSRRTFLRPSHGRRGAGCGKRAFDLPLEESLLAPAVARRCARGVLESWGLDVEQVYDTLLVISELVTNAVTHAVPPVVLHLSVDEGHGQVRVCVSDGGKRKVPAAWTGERPEGEHGRGNLIISALVDECGAGLDAEGLIDHWADLPAA